MRPAAGLGCQNSLKKEEGRIARPSLVVRGADADQAWRSSGFPVSPSTAAVSASGCTGVVAADEDDADATTPVQPDAETAAVDGETGKPEERHA